MPDYTVALPTLHEDQVRAFYLKEDHRVNDETISEEERQAWAKNSGGRYRVYRCGRRWGKSVFGETWIADGAIKGQPTGWFAPDYNKLAEVFEDFLQILDPVIARSNKSDKVIRLKTGGRIDFWTLENESAGRSRHYRRIFIDEAAFAKANMLHIWRSSIEPTLFDYTGHCWVGSNTNGISEDNFMWQICNQPEHGFIEYHAPTANNPILPKCETGETEESHAKRRLEELAKLEASKHPLVWLQEYKAEFVNWSGVSFFITEKLLVDGKPVPAPVHCDAVFAVLDTASKTGTENDATGVTYWARNKYSGIPLVLLDWDAVQIQAAMLETWLPSVFANLDHWAKVCGARGGSAGAWIEDKDSGVVLLQQSANKGFNAHAIDSKLTALGKDGRAFSVSGYYHQELAKITEHAFNKRIEFKGATRNHLLTQLSNFRIGDPDAAKRADDLLDSFTYGLAMALGNKDGF